MNQNWIKEIQSRVEKVPISSGRSDKAGRITFDDLVFVPAQLAKRPVDYFRDGVSAKTIIGKNSKKPIEIQTPIIIGAMSFGALSRQAKIALAKASTLAGTMENTGEGGVLPEEREFSDKLVVQYSTGRFGITEEILKKADAIEIKIGQGAKPGQGGLLLGEKVTKEIAEVREVPLGENITSPAYHLDIKNIEDLRRKVEWLRGLAGGGPIILKLGAGDMEADIKLAVRADPDVIAIDGLEAGTGAAPEVMLNEVGIPTLAALVKAREVLNKLGAKQELWIGGGLNKGGDFAKALALGADAVFCAFPLLIAMGCIYCQQCYLGKCPKGITTQDPELRKNLNIENNIHDLNKNHLRALNSEIAKMTGIKLCSE
jgi:glutamate synthase domain-containing protein 2